MNLMQPIEKLVLWQFFMTVGVLAVFKGVLLLGASNEIASIAAVAVAVFAFAAAAKEKEEGIAFWFFLILFAEEFALVYWGLAWLAA